MVSGSSATSISMVSSCAGRVISISSCSGSSTFKGGMSLPSARALRAAALINSSALAGSVACSPYFSGCASASASMYGARVFHVRKASRVSSESRLFTAARICFIVASMPCAHFSMLSMKLCAAGCISFSIFCAARCPASASACIPSTNPGIATICRPISANTASFFSSGNKSICDKGNCISCCNSS